MSGARVAVGAPVDGVASGCIQHSYLTQSVFKAVSQKATPPQIRQRILHISNSNGEVDRFLEELTSAKQLLKTLCVR